MHNLYANFVRILDICKEFAKNLVNEHGNLARRGPVPKFSDLEVIALSLMAESLSIDEGEEFFCIDSKPIPVCRNARAKRCVMGNGNYEKAPTYGYCASQQMYFYGYKLHSVD